MGKCWSLFSNDMSNWRGLWILYKISFIILIYFDGFQASFWLKDKSPSLLLSYQLQTNSGSVTKQANIHGVHMFHTHLPLCAWHEWMFVLTCILKAAMVLGALYSQEVSSYYNIMHIDKKKIFKQYTLWTKNIISTNIFRHTIFGLKSLPPARSSPTNKYLFWAVLFVRCFTTPEIASMKSSRKLQCNILMENHWSRVTYIKETHKTHITPTYAIFYNLHILSFTQLLHVSKWDQRKIHVVHKDLITMYTSTIFNHFNI